MIREYPESRIAVDEVSLFVDKKRSVCVAVECDSKIRFFFEVTLAERLDMKRAAVEIDVATVGTGINRNCLRAKPFE